MKAEQSQTEGSGISRFLLAGLFVAAGVFHFIRPEIYRPLIPPYLPKREALVAISGAAEIAGGLGILFRRTRRAAGWGLVLLLIAVFPANIHMLTSREPVLGTQPPAWLLWARLPLQGVLIFWVLRVMRVEQKSHV